MAKIKGHIVVDTSVIVKLFFVEENSEQADLLLSGLDLKQIQFIVPSSLALEFVNVLWVKVRRGPTTRPEAENILRRFVQLSGKIQIIDYASLLGAIFGESIGLDHPAYDTAFTVLAKRLKVPFITADRKLHNKLLANTRLSVLLRDVEI